MNNEFQKRLISSVILFPLITFLILKGSYYFLTLLLISFFIAIYEWLIMSKNKPYNILGFLFIICSFYSMYQMRISEENSLINIFIVLFVCILTDIGGYVFGKIFKGPKLISYSPNKTYSGLIGSYILPFLIPLLINYKLIDNSQTLSLAIFIFLISTVSQIGDLIVSYFKRRSKIKDTGKLIPGHGGILDRIDGMLFAFLFAYLIMLINILEFV